MPATNGVHQPAFLTNEQFAQLRELTTNAITTRADLWRNFFSQLDRRRSIEDECGYPREVSVETYQNLYDREPIPARVVEVLPLECWQVQPQVYEKEAGDKATAFEAAWDALGRSLRGERSYYQDEAGSPVWEYLKRLDVLSGVGHYGVLLLGLDDGLPLSQPVRGWQEQGSEPADRDPKAAPPPSANGVLRPYRLTTNAAQTKGRKLTFLRVFPETLAPILRFETNPLSPRYGQPTAYQLTLGDAGTSATGYGVPLGTYEVHWSRVIHVADGRQSSEVFGAPRMRPVLHRLLDLRKLYGGSAEMYWKGAFPGFAWETQPQLGGDVDVDQNAMRDSMEAYFNGLQRYLLGTGMSIKSLAPQVVDPTAQISIQLQAICIKIGIPQRVFMGSERGELASGQDDKAWNDRLRERQVNYVTPRVVVPVVDRLIAAGVLPEPDGYSVEWPDLTSKSDQEKAAVAQAKTTAISTYVQSGADALMAPVDFLTRVLDFDEEEANAILETAAREAEDKASEQQAVADQHGYQPAPPPGFKAPEPPAVPEPSVNALDGDLMAALAAADVLAANSFNPDQPRDDSGRFAGGEVRPEHQP